MEAKERGRDLGKDVKDNQQHVVLGSLVTSPWEIIKTRFYGPFSEQLLQCQARLRKAKK